MAKLRLKILGDRLKYLMNLDCYTQDKLAKEIGLTQKAISSWINNRTEPCLDSLCQIADVLNTTIDFLLGR